MLNAKNERMLAYTEKIAWIAPIEGADNIELVGINGWTCIAKIGEFKPGDMCVYFEIDSKLPEADWSSFMEAKHYKVKTMKLGKFKVISQGLALPISAFVGIKIPTELHADCTQLLGVTYSVAEDNARKANSVDKYTKMTQRHKKLFKNKFIQKIYSYSWGKKALFTIFGRKRDKRSSWPVGVFPGVAKTDQERCENMPWVLKDKTPFIKTQKCDGTSGTYILERKKFGRFEFYVCSRNVRMMNEKQECFYGADNHYWDAVIKYDIENKMKDYLNKNKDISFVCWQGEICGPGIQNNPHKLKEKHLFCFHMTDSKNGRYDIREAKKIWDSYNMESVPIVNENYILPDDFETFKADADGFYDPIVCEGNKQCSREGFVYYKTTDPTFSFKNVSRKYLLKHSQ